MCLLKVTVLLKASLKVTYMKLLGYLYKGREQTEKKDKDK